MAPDKKKIASASWKRGSEAMAREDWDYAIEMFAQCVALVPDNLMYRQMLRGVEYRKYGNNKSGARMAGVKLMTIRGGIKKAKMQKNWDSVDSEAERGLQVNPWDGQLNADLGEACRERELMEIAVFSYEKAFEADQTNKDFLRPLAELYEERGEYDKARNVYARLSKLDPDNSEYRRKESSLLAARAMNRSGYEDAESTKDVKSQPQNAYSDFGPGATEDTVAPGEDPETDLRHQIRRNPENKDLYLKLADLLQKENRLDDAVAEMQKALELSGGDQNIREQLEDIELLKMKQAADTAADRYKAAPTDEKLKAQASGLRTEFYKREIQTLSTRTERYPKNMRLKFDLAQRFMKFKKWDQAIPLLQQASSDSRIETETRVLLGECFLNDNKKPLAARQFETALKQVNQHDQPDLYLTCHYVLGRLAEEKGTADAAIDHYSEVLSLDYNYRDTRTRLEKLQAG